MPKIELIAGSRYRLKNGDDITVKKNCLPYYCFSAVVADDNYLAGEVWTADGVAYHDDCGFSVIAEVQS